MLDDKEELLLKDKLVIEELSMKAGSATPPLLPSPPLPSRPLLPLPSPPLPIFHDTITVAHILHEHTT
jgi:hypothetical protein